MNALITYVQNKIMKVLNVVPVVQHYHDRLIFQWQQNTLTIQKEGNHATVTLDKSAIDDTADVLYVVKLQNINAVIDIIVEFERLIQLIRYHLRLHGQTGNSHQIEDAIYIDWPSPWFNRYAINIVDIGTFYKVYIYNVHSPIEDKIPNYSDIVKKIFNVDYRDIEEEIFKVHYRDIDQFIDDVFNRFYPRRIY